MDVKSNTIINEWLTKTHTTWGKKTNKQMPLQCQNYGMPTLALGWRATVTRGVSLEQKEQKKTEACTICN